jgi:hypothetical protein
MSRSKRSVGKAVATSCTGSAALPRNIRTEDLLKSGLADTSVDATNAIYGLSIGREVTAGSGKRILYLTDWDGNIFTLTPQ